MLQISNIHMSYPVPRRYKDLFTKPLKKEYAQALTNINITIEPGDKIAFLGTNGAGKTTLLKLIGGLLFPTQGSIVINGYDTLQHNIEARRSVGFILNEERSFYWRLTGVQNLEFFGALDNLFGQQLQDKIAELVDLVGLGNAGKKLVAGYSSGMKQKLAIARGLLSDPSILILDEPTRTLDPIAAEDIKELIQNKIHAQTERTLLIATHRLEEAEALCNKVCVMNKGRIMALTTVDEAMRSYASLYDFYTSTINASQHAYQELY